MDPSYIDSRHRDAHWDKALRVSWRVRFAAVITVLLVLRGDAVFGQDRPDAASAQSRPVVISPSFQLRDVGWDDNVFRTNKIDHPTGDFMATVSPGVQGSARGSRVIASGRTNVDLVYFHRFAEIRSIEPAASGRAAVLVGRVTPYLEAAWAKIRDRRNLEIDLPVRRVDSNWVAGLDFTLSGKTSVGVATRHSHSRYNGDTLYLDTDLAQALDSATAGEGIHVRYRLTPITTVEGSVEWERDDFPRAPERNSDGFRVVSGVTFSPLAYITGSASLGVRSRTFRDGKVPPFDGAVGRIDLAYVLMGNTQFSVRAERDLSDSYRVDERDYLQIGAALTATHRFRTAWDIEGTVGRYHLTYRVASLVEQVDTYGVGIGYHIERTRLGFNVSRQTRTSEFSPIRDYEQMRITSSMSYGF